VSAGAASLRPRTGVPGWRAWCLGGAVVVTLLALLPPLSTAARRDEFAAALQFSLLAIALPAAVALGAPWRLFGLAAGTGTGATPGMADRIADRRKRHRELAWSLVLVGCDIGAAIAWHTPGAVAALTRQGWLVAVEAASLLVFGLGLWFELVESPPLTPRSGHLRRAVLAAAAMWSFWILAYVAGLSNHGFYRNFHHLAGGLSGAADQEIASALLWFVAAAAFMPVIFWNAFRWIQTDDDPDAELLALARADRRRGLPPMASGSGGPAAT
jgi:cytochrome c oxidase assembly factor CtaG